MAMSLSRKTYFWTAAGVVVAAVAVGVKLARSEANPAPRTDLNQSGTGNVQLNGDNNVVTVASTLKGLTREAAEARAKNFDYLAPPAGQPAPFLVIEAPNHLWVRSSGTTSGHHIGAAHNETVVWADCTATTDFDPDPTDSIGPVWLRIRWNTDKPNDNLSNSQPGDRYPGWVYAGQTIRVGHNGEIPTCVNP
ncbi:hypothetical protein [Micromonospora carbonacea]|uniref:Uncharacterized protein n=1 Tax=Micromonospora carbonacea TaxID=47853 RepID=A0A7H8XQ66_9ACTN|nr:hypothetical protein [Micromonospora carbonacea]MBB5824916.1 hypothetical protein [Micromonospora carbonacea]QLD26955.1 hypothetical protein HXZ27_24335 [Micromonospora carbonacea]